MLRTMVIAALLAIGCGDSDDPVDTAADAAPPPDARCEPRLVVSGPMDGDTDVDPSQPYVLTQFERTLVESELGVFALLSGGSQLPAAVTLNADDPTIVKIEPDDPFQPATVYQVVVPCETITFETAP